MKTSLLAFATLACATATATTYVWNPTTKSGSYYYWTNAANWLVDGKTATSYPNSADAIVEIPDGKITGRPGGKCRVVRYTGATNFPSMSQGTLTLVEGGKLWFTSFQSTDNKAVSWYSTIICGDSDETGEVEYNIPKLLTLKIQKDITGTCALVKTGEGVMTDAYDTPNATTPRKFAVKNLILKEGTFNLWANSIDEGLNIAFDGTSDDSRLCYGAAMSGDMNLEIRSGSITETAQAEGTGHGFTTYSKNLRQLTFTGTPKVNPMRFTGKFYNKAGLCWAPDDAACEFDYAKNVSDTTGQLIVSNGTVRLREGASFTALSRVEVARGTLRVDVACGLDFHADAMEVAASGATLNLGQGVVLACDALSVGGVAQQEGVYTSANTTWITGTGCVEVGEQTRPSTILTIDDGTGFSFSSPVEYVGIALNTTGDYVFEADAGASVTLGAQGIVATNATAARTITIAAPVLVSGTETWRFSSNDTVVISGPIISTRTGGTWQIAGAKEVQFRGENVFKHTLAISNAVARFYGNAIAANDGGTISFVPVSGARAHFYGVTTAKHLIFSGSTPGSLQSMVSFHASEDKTVNTHLFTGYCEINLSGNQFFAIDNGVTARFTGGVYKSGGMFGTYGNGTMVVANKILRPARLNMNAYSTIVLEVANNYFGNNAGQVYGHSRLITRVPYALTAYSGSTVRARLTIASTATLDLDGNDQSIASINANGTVTSPMAALLHLVDNAIAGTADGGSTSQVTRVKFTDGAGFSKDGCLTNYLYVASTSTGTVQVTQGRLVLPAAGSEPLQLYSGTYPRPKANIGWANASKAVVSGGEMVLEHSQAFGKNVAVEIGGGRLVLAEGVRQRCATLTLDGEAANPGTYGSSESNADIKDDVHFAGPGVLRVGKFGMVLFVQ